MNVNVIGQVVVTVIVLVVVVFVLVILARSIRIIPQASAGIVERLGAYHTTLQPGLRLLVPFIDPVSYTHLT
ncbi:MAG: SPFH/Band 7/PHB domain protein, partial [Actinomycetales bacterium]|nr:SPFH/Band 7/PHB domain protein [Actinomycetales bacterium]